jgi:phage tail-like protein
MATRDTDPLLGFNFRLELNEKVAGFFSECSGIGSENEVIDHKIVTDAGIEIVQKIPGRLKWTEVTLKRGITADMKMWEWRKQVEEGDMKGARTNCSIILMDREHKDTARWNFINAWPSKVSGPSIKADSNEFGVEEFVLVHEGLERKDKG